MNYTSTPKFLGALLLLYFQISVQGYSQTTNLGTKVIPPSPNAASLGVYGQVPVSLYTGLPNISIPLYTVNYHDITLPITLSYHAQGVKVDQDASWVGLGWSLSAGGMITRTVRNYDDIMRDNLKIGYPYLDGTNMPVVDAPGSQYYDQNIKDYEPDIFYFNFAGKAGKFILDKATYTGEKIIIKGISLSAEKISIIYYPKSTTTTPHPEPGYWEIITADGYLYRFETKEYTFMRRSSGQHNQFDGYGADASCLNSVSTGNAYGEGILSALEDYDNNAVHPNKDSKQVGAWQLNKIISPTGAHITFIYDTLTTSNYASLSPLMRTENNSGGFDLVSGSGTMAHTSQLITKERLLKEIQFGNGKIEFLTEGREDIKTLNAASIDPTLSRYNITTNPPQRLKQIKVTHLNSTYSKIVDFKYSYFNNGKSSEFLRLKLDELVENGGKKHIFLYNENKALPSKNSFDKDHWGYYNGEWDNYFQAKTQVPLMIYQPYGSSNYTLLNPSRTSQEIFSIRRPDKGVIVNAQTGERDYPYMKAGILTKIIYPTKGSTTFEYEPNTYEQMNISDDADSWQEQIISQSNGESAVFEVNQNTFAKIIISGSSQVRLTSYSAPSDLVTIIPVDNLGNSTISYGAGIIHDCDPPYSSLPPNTGQDQTSWNYNCTSFKWSTDGYSKQLPKGKYKIIVKTITASNANGTFSLNANIKIVFPNFDTNTTRTGGGLRVKRVIDSDGVNLSKDLIKVYDYTIEQYGAIKSSGKLMSNVIKYCFPTDYTDDNGNNRKGYCIRSSTTYPLSNSAQGSAIGYSKVTVNHGLNAENGREEYLFINESNHLRPLTQYNNCKYIPDFPNATYVDNGFIYQQIHWAKVGNVFKSLKEISCNPKFSKVKSFPAYKFWGRWTSYAFHSIWMNYTDEIVRDYYYDSQGNQQVKSITTKTYYDNKVHFLPTRVVQEGVNGDSLISRTFYPADYSDVDAGAVVNTMKTSKHIHNSPVQKVMIRKGSDAVENVLSSQIYRYDLGPTGSSFIKNSEVYQLHTAKPLNFNNIEEFPIYRPASWNYNDKTKFERKIALKYNLKGNLIEYRAEDGIVVTIIWGYDASYPVAEIKNATYTEVETALGGSAAINSIESSFNLSQTQINGLNGLRNLLPNALISTFTFDPLLGMLSQTGPDGITGMFDYDASGRLAVIKDARGNIIKQYLYHYKQGVSY